MTPSLGLDHVYLRVHDLDAMLDFFQRRLGLPLSWPVCDEPFAQFAWVNAGNVQLELWQARSDQDLPSGTSLPCVAGLGLWPEDVHASRKALERAGIACKEPRAWRTVASGREALNFTNCLVLDASAPACQVFFCEWDPNAPIAPWPKGESTADRRDRLAKELADQDGGAIGLVGMRAVHMRSPDPAATARVWKAITGSAGVVAPKVALFLDAGPELRIEAMEFGVVDLHAAQTSLIRKGFRGERHGNVLWLDPRQTFGLRLALSGV